MPAEHLMDLIHEEHRKITECFLPGLAVEFQENADRKGIRPQIAPQTLTCRRKAGQIGKSHYDVAHRGHGLAPQHGLSSAQSGYDLRTRVWQISLFHLGLLPSI